MNEVIQYISELYNNNLKNTLEPLLPYISISSILYVLYRVFTGLYHLIYKHKDDTIQQKDSTIELKDSTIEGLREEIKSLQEKLLEAKKNSPEALIERIQTIRKGYEDELDIANKEILKSKELQQSIEDKENKIDSLNKAIDSFSSSLNNIKEEKSKLEDILEGTDAICPICRSPMTNSEHRWIGEEPYEHDAMYLEYECGYSHVDGIEETPCGNK